MVSWWTSGVLIYSPSSDGLYINTSDGHVHPVAKILTFTDRRACIRALVGPSKTADTERHRGRGREGGVVNFQNETPAKFENTKPSTE